MNYFYKSIILVIIAFVAVVGFAPQAKAHDVDAITAATCKPQFGCFEQTEVCVDGLCVAGESCNNDADCDDMLFCTGVESCSSENSTCVIGTAPCEASQTCNEATDTCEGDECNDDVDCDDAVFCNGVETCVGGECVLDTDPCEPLICVEADEECVECEDDLDCEDDETCENNVCEAACSYPPEVKDFDDDENCYLSKEELKAAKTFYKEEHKKQKDALKLSQGEDKAFLKSLKEYAE